MDFSGPSSVSASPGSSSSGRGSTASRMSSSSTLVETVSINYEDFSDSFLTCSTCLYMYNSAERTPKLLACSHTVCQSCLEHIVEAQISGSGPAGRAGTTNIATTFRCPICRETITVPRGGVTAFPPSFIVNQLLDLMGRQRRDVVPKCARHSQSELMFCETCDVVFCVDCAGASHAGTGSTSVSGGGGGVGGGVGGGGASAHTVIPFSVAIKRMSEILLYKASLCMKNLDGAASNVTDEMRKLEEASERCVESAVKAFEEIASAVDRRRDDVIATVRRVRDEKKRVLREQLNIIESERCRVRADCDGLQSQVDVRNITAKISDLNEKLDMSATLVEPRENAFMAFEYNHNSAAAEIGIALSQFGKVTISKTFPALCTASGSALQKAIAHLHSKVTVVTVDYHGNPRTGGGDPLTAELQSEAVKGETVVVDVCDNDDGTYTLTFTPLSVGVHHLNIRIFDRPIKDSPFTVDVSEHIEHVEKFGGSGGSGGSQQSTGSLKQPVSVVVVGGDGDVYVLDAGNSRIAVLDRSLKLKRFITGSVGLEERGAVGMTSNLAGNLVIVNWRTKKITELTVGGELIRQLTSARLVAPTAVAVSSKNELIVADNEACSIFILDWNGNILSTIGTKGSSAGQFMLINAVYCTPSDEIIVCDHRLQVFKREGQYVCDIGTCSSGSTPSHQRGTYSGVCIDQSGRLLATRSEKGRCIVQVFGADRRWQFDIDSSEDRLRRPSGIASDSYGFVYVADLGNDCVKKFPYV